jgi:hypothetical protein
MELTHTPEQVAKHIVDAYDSVTLIATLKTKPSLTEKETKRLAANKKHIEIMLSLDWFSSALTPEQKTELEAV